jgi:hypothetical protein
MGLKRFGGQLNYVRGEDNVVADALSPLHMNEESTFVEYYMDVYDITQDVGFDPEDLPTETFPVKFATIAREQTRDEILLAKVQQSSPNYYSIVSFRAGGKNIDLICCSGKISIPKTLQSRVMHWSHTTLAVSSW